MVIGTAQTLINYFPLILKNSCEDVIYDVYYNIDLTKEYIMFTFTRFLFRIQTIANIVSGLIKVFFLFSKLSYRGGYS